MDEIEQDDSCYVAAVPSDDASIEVPSTNETPQPADEPPAELEKKSEIKTPHLIRRPNSSSVPLLITFGPTSGGMNPIMPWTNSVVGQASPHATRRNNDGPTSG
jgi:hypothetical protein